MQFRSLWAVVFTSLMFAFPAEGQQSSATVRLSGDEADAKLILNYKYERRGENYEYSIIANCEAGQEPVVFFEHTPPSKATYERQNVKYISDLGGLITGGLFAIVAFGENEAAIREEGNVFYQDPDDKMLFSSFREEKEEIKDFIRLFSAPKYIFSVSSYATLANRGRFSWFTSPTTTFYLDEEEIVSAAVFRIWCEKMGAL